MQQNSNYLASKSRYEILDGLRGVAAMLVVVYHLLETYHPNLVTHPLNHGYLAVDFFFVLSGFVVGYAYDDRWNRMSLWYFAKRRLIRLHPMLIIGTLVGLLMFYFTGDHPDFGSILRTPLWLALLTAAWCLTMVPVPPMMDLRGWGEFNPFNGATWSLLWEYLANALYALFIRRLSNTVLTLCVGLFALLTIALCMNIDFLCVLDARSYAAYTVVGGWSLTPDQLLIGATRLLYPFFAGLLLSRLMAGRRTLDVRGGFWWCSMAIVVVLVMPRVGGEAQANWWMNGIYEAACILVVFPLIVAFGASSSTRGRTTVVNRFLGDISYPLYITHYPLIYWQMSWSATHRDLPASVHVFVAICIFLLALALAYASLRLYDEPVRGWLRRRELGELAVGKSHV